MLQCRAARRLRARLAATRSPRSGARGGDPRFPGAPGRGGQSPFIPRTPQKEPVPNGSRFWFLTHFCPNWHRANCRTKNEQLQRENRIALRRRAQSGRSHVSPQPQNAGAGLARKTENHARKPAGFYLRFFWRWLKTGHRARGDRTEYTGFQLDKCKIPRENRPLLPNEAPN